MAYPPRLNLWAFRRRVMVLSGSLRVLALTLALASIASAQAAPSPTLDDQVRSVAARLRCPVCQNESVADSPAELAAQMRTIIRERLQRGDTPDQIIGYFVAKYGEWILLDPPRRGLGWLLWLAPLAALALSLAVAGAFLRRTVRPSAGQGVRQD